MLVAGVSRSGGGKGGKVCARVSRSLEPTQAAPGPLREVGHGAAGTAKEAAPLLRLELGRLLLSDQQCYTPAGPNPKPLARESGNPSLQASGPGSRVWPGRESVGLGVDGKTVATPRGILTHGSSETCSPTLCPWGSGVNPSPVAPTNLGMGEEFPGNHPGWF